MPDPQPKRVRVAEQLTSPRRVAPPLDEEALRQRLRAIREDTAQHLDALLSQLTSTLGEQYGITPLEATTAQEAADEIARLAGPSRRVLVNRSATVAELLPYLEAHGLEVVETYDQQFMHPEQGVERYWQLQLPSAEAAWEAFRPFVVNWEPGKLGNWETGKSVNWKGQTDSPIYQSTSLPTDLGVLGVNVIAADDGTVFFVQHLFNISEILQQASQVVLVVGVERVVRDLDSAAFVAKAQARYGVLSVALGVPRRGGDSKGKLPAGQGLIPSPLAHDVQPAPMHVILLDNGRRAWLNDPRYRDLFLCIGCRSCLLECPTQLYFGGETGWTPRDYLAAFLRGDNPSLGECITCGRCRARCPLDIDLPAMISEAEAEAGATTWQDQFYCNIGLLFHGSSLTAPLSNWLFNWPLARLPMEWVAGLDRERKLPRFHRDTFVNQYHRRFRESGNQEIKKLGNQGIRGSGNERMPDSPITDFLITDTVIYYPGCYVNFTDPELGWAVVGVLERNGFRVSVPKHLCCGVACFPYGAKELARWYARRALKVFGPLARQGYTILVSCPSCGTSLERDYPYLLPDSEDARLVAEHTRDVSDFLWALHQHGELDTNFNPLELRLGYHTPCHLRVRGLGPENLRLLELVPGMEPVDIDRGCCGLAGSFGMRREHREESRQIGRYLFQELQSPDYDLGVTNCAGCEMQMRAGSGREVVHPLKLLWQAYSGR